MKRMMQLWREWCSYEENDAAMKRMMQLWREGSSYEENDAAMKRMMQLWREWCSYEDNYAALKRRKQLWREWCSLDEDEAAMKRMISAYMRMKQLWREWCSLDADEAAVEECEFPSDKEGFLKEENVCWGKGGISSIFPINKDSRGKEEKCKESLETLLAWAWITPCTSDSIRGAPPPATSL